MDVENLNKNPQIDQESALKLFEEGAVLFLLDVPVGTEFGIDMNSWNTGEKFKGVKMIPPGLHYVHYRYVTLLNIPLPILCDLKFAVLSTRKVKQHHVQDSSMILRGGKF